MLKLYTGLEKSFNYLLFVVVVVVVVVAAAAAAAAVVFSKEISREMKKHVLPSWKGEFRKNSFLNNAFKTNRITSKFHICTFFNFSLTLMR